MTATLTPVPTPHCDQAGTGHATVLRGDARQLPLPDNSVDIVVTSPPYYGQRAYQDDGESYGQQLGNEASPAAFIDNLIDCTREWIRVLKPSGSLFINLGDSYYSGKGASCGIDAKQPARRFGIRPLDRSGLGYPRKSLLLLPERYRIACLDKLGCTVRAVIIWSKLNPTPERGGDRVRRTHEDWVHLTLGPRYYDNVDALREQPSHYQRAHNAPRVAAPGQKPRGFADATNQRGRTPGSVWNVASEPLVVPAEVGAEHAAAFPTSWPRRIITGWCPLDGVVLDPMGGTGTTALVAKALGRHGITVDRSSDYCRLATWRVNDPKQLAKAAGINSPRSGRKGA